MAAEFAKTTTTDGASSSSSSGARTHTKQSDTKDGRRRPQIEQYCNKGNLHYFIFDSSTVGLELERRAVEGRMICCLGTIELQFASDENRDVYEKVFQDVALKTDFDHVLTLTSTFGTNPEGGQYRLLLDMQYDRQLEVRCDEDRLHHLFDLGREYWPWPSSLYLQLNQTSLQLFAFAHPQWFRGRYLQRQRLTKHLKVLHQLREAPIPGRERIKEDLQEFYAQLKKQRDEQEYLTPSVDPQHVGLAPTLRRYQKEAVLWMLTRETNPNAHGTCEWRRPNAFLDQFTTTDGRQCFYSQATGKLFMDSPPPLVLPQGGILADEMGLGKTVEILALTLLNPSPPIEEKEIDKAQTSSDPDGEPRAKKERLNREGELVCCCHQKKLRNEQQRKATVLCAECGTRQHRVCVDQETDADTHYYLCPKCLDKHPPLNGKTTLIVSPESISYQWYEEIKRHVKAGDDFRVLVYEGVKKSGYVHPSSLVSYDLVICSYETLRSELDYASRPELTRALRYSKRYISPPSPLTAVHWWRVCLDEAQMVESVSTKAAAMCARLSATNRWCVTGTPLNKSVFELYGLFCFLGGEDPNVDKWFQLLWQPYLAGDIQPMVNEVSRVIWRREKVDVEDQLNLPEQTLTTTVVDFSPIEEHFYRRTFDVCATAFQTTVATIRRQQPHVTRATPLRELDRQTLDQLLRPLMSLIKACLHPSAVPTANPTGNRLPLIVNKWWKTMEEVLDKMVKDTRRECEVEHRALIAALNGQAGVHWLQGNEIEAANLYRAALASCRRYQDHLQDVHFRTDPLQQIHALTNLDLLLSKNGEKLPLVRADNELNLKDEVSRLSNDYVKEGEQKVAAEVDRYRHQKQRLDEFGDIAAIRWFADICDWAREQNREEDLLTYVRAELANAVAAGQPVTLTFGDSNGLCYVLATFLQQLVEQRRELETTVGRYLRNDEPTLDRLRATVCHLRPVGAPLRTCILCKAWKGLQNYESRLYRFNDDSETNEEAGTRRGTWARSLHEEALLRVVMFARKRDYPQAKELSGERDPMHLFSRFRKHFGAVRALIMACFDETAKRDELTMASERIQLALNTDRAVTTVDADLNRPINIVNKCNLIPLLHQNACFVWADEREAKTRLDVKRGRMIYLKGLEKQRRHPLQGNLEQCPVCREPIGYQWSILLCGHCFCLNCSEVLYHSREAGASATRVRCAVCRVQCGRGNISYVSLPRVHEYDVTGDDGEQQPVIGDYSTKIECVVRRLMSIRRREPTAKALVFSAQQPVLTILSEALKQNELAHIVLGNGAKKKQESLQAFKHGDEKKILLLPVWSGANGLNLTEATHVLFVESLLNPAAEQQAIGRIHRIGQTHTTTVHRFVIRGTIEQHIDSLIHGHDSQGQTEQQPGTSGGGDRLNGIDARTAQGATELADGRITVGQLTELFSNGK